MILQIVKCPNKKCGHEFATKRNKTQCGKCGKKFTLHSSEEVKHD